MTGQETKDAMTKIAQCERAVFTEKLNALPKNAKTQTERKALKICEQLAGNCSGFVQIDFSGHFYDTREKRIFSQNWNFFETYKEAYQKLDGDDKESFLVYAFAVSMVKMCFLDQRMKKLEAAEAVTDVELIFESKIILGVLGKIMDGWRTWWKENGCFPCEV